MSMLSRFATLGGAPTDPYWSNVSFLLVGNGTNGTTTNIKDSSSNNLPVTSNNAVITTANSKYGGSSLTPTSTSVSISTPDNAGLQFGTSPFTMEMWFNTSATTTYSSLISKDSPWSWLVNSTNNDGKIVYYDGALAPSLLISTTGGYNNGVWHYVALVRAPTLLSIYVDGALVASKALSAGDSSGAGGTMYIASSAIGSRAYSGYMYDIRITKGVARYSGSTMTVPTGPLPIG